MNRETNLVELYYFYFTDIAHNMEHKKYYYLDEGTFMQAYIQGIAKGNLCKSMQMYWEEMLHRAHFAAATSILRNQRWLSGVKFGLDNNNIMVFASSLRGFLESVTDSLYSLESVPTSFALNFKNINKAVKGDLKQAFMSSELESKLIHYEFAKKSKEKNNSDLIALTSAEYIKQYDMHSDAPNKELYAVLCELTHPSSRSISCFTTEITVSEDYSYNMTSVEAEIKTMDEIMKKYYVNITQLMKLSLIAATISLKLISMFDFIDTKSEYINECAVNKIISSEGWQEILEMIDKGGDYLQD